MIERQSIINAIRELGFVYKNESARVEMWKQKGTPKRLELQKKDLFTEDFAKSFLKRAGMPEADILCFINQCSKASAKKAH